MQVITADTQHSFVLGREGGERSTLLLFYNPLCPHCRELLATLETLVAEVGQGASSSGSIAVGKLDVTLNSVEEPFEVQAVPTLYFKPADGFLFKYRGLRSVADLKALLQSGGTADPSF